MILIAFKVSVITLCILAFCHVFGRRDCYNPIDGRNHGKGGGSRG